VTAAFGESDKRTKVTKQTDPKRTEPKKLQNPKDCKTNPTERRAQTFAQRTGADAVVADRVPVVLKVFDAPVANARIDLSKTFVTGFVQRALAEN
jgi:hypothetical protein